MTGRPLPRPTAQRLRGHLGRFGNDPLDLLEEGARSGKLFELMLWRPIVVGYSPDWNRLLAQDLEVFPSTGSLSGLTPYLRASLPHTDGAPHRAQRRALNPPFSPRAVAELGARLAATAQDVLPEGEFDATAWSSATVRQQLNTAFFADRFPSALLAEFLTPLDAAMPGPLLPRPVLFARMNHALRQAISVARPPALAAALRDVPDAVSHIRVALAAGYDTTAHTLAWAIWHLQEQTFADDASLTRHIEEILRLYPAGWIGSRRVHRRVRFAGRELLPGARVLYSPYLTHRDPALWSDPLRFRPERFTESPPPFGYLPFFTGERSCLGAHLARLVLRTSLQAFSAGRPRQVRGDPRPRASLTLAPSGPLMMRR